MSLLLIFSLRLSFSNFCFCFSSTACLKQGHETDFTGGRGGNQGDIVGLLLWFPKKSGFFRLRNSNNMSFGRWWNRNSDKIAHKTNWTKKIQTSIAKKNACTSDVIFLPSFRFRIPKKWFEFLSFPKLIKKFGCQKKSKEKYMLLTTN